MKNFQATEILWIGIVLMWIWITILIISQLLRKCEKKKFLAFIHSITILGSLLKFSREKYS